MKPYDLMKTSSFSLTPIATPAMLSAQGTPPPEIPVTPEIPMPPGAPNPSLPPDEVPAQPATPDLPPEHIASVLGPHAAQNNYPPCTATLQDECMNTRPEQNVNAPTSSQSLN